MIHSVIIHLPVKAAFSRSQRNRQTVTLGLFGLLLEELDIHKLNMLVLLLLQNSYRTETKIKK